MKKNFAAFTIIELIVVSSILILVSATSVFYFGNFLDSYKLKSRLNIINSELEVLDLKVKSKKIFDYELSLNKGSGSYIVYKNNFDIDNHVNLSLSGLSGNLIIVGTKQGDWRLKILSDGKILTDTFLDSNSSFNYFLGDYSNYSIFSYLSGVKLNDIDLTYFTENPNEEPLVISGIYKDQNKSSEITNLVVKNIGGKKVIGDNLEEAYVFFDMLGQEEFIKIIK